MLTNGEHAGYEYYARTKERFEKAGIRIYGFGNRDVHNQDAIVLGLERRDAKIEEYVNHLQALGKAGIPYTTYAHMANGIWSTERELTRGAASARGFDLAEAEVGHWAEKLYCLPLTHGRVYSQDEIWENFRYFVEKAAPVAEEAGVRIGIHPTTRPNPNWAACRAVFSAAMTAMNAPCTSLTAPMWASASASAAGWKAAS